MVCAVSSYPNLAQHAHWLELDNILSMILFSILPKKSSALFSCLLLSIYLTCMLLSHLYCVFIHYIVLLLLFKGQNDIKYQQIKCINDKG